MPTKVFEYLTYGLPIISQTNTIWTDYAMKHKACIPVDFDQVDAEKVAVQLNEFITSYEPKDLSVVKWDTEGKKLINMIDDIMSL